MKVILVIASLVPVLAIPTTQVDDYITDDLLDKLATHGIIRQQLQEYLKEGRLKGYAVLFGLYDILRVEPPKCLATDAELQAYLYKAPDYEDEEILELISKLLDMQPASGR